MRADGMMLSSPVSSLQPPVGLRSTVFGLLRSTLCGGAAGRRLLVAALLLLVVATPGQAMDDTAPGDKHARPTEGEDAEALGVAPVPVPPAKLPSLWVGGAALAADTLPTDAVSWASLVEPPALGAAMQGGGGGGGPVLEYYALDALGSVRVVFDATGAVKARADYEPFGAAVPASTTGPLPREQFTGQQRDEVGLDYFGARFYHATHGRMLSVDPLYVGAVGDPQRWNRYAYAMNSPIVVTDPDGRTGCATTYVVGGFTHSCPNGPSTTGGATGGASVNTPSAGQPSQIGYTGGGNADYEALSFPGGFGYRVVPEPCGGLTRCPMVGSTVEQSSTASNVSGKGSTDATTGTSDSTGTDTGDASVVFVGREISLYAFLNISRGAGIYFDWATGELGLYYRSGHGIGSPWPTLSNVMTFGAKNRSSLDAKDVPSANFHFILFGVSPSSGEREGSVGPSVCPSLEPWLCAASSFAFTTTRTFPLFGGR